MTGRVLNISLENWMESVLLNFYGLTGIDYYSLTESDDLKIQLDYLIKYCFIRKYSNEVTYKSILTMMKHYHELKRDNPNPLRPPRMYPQ